MLCRDSTGFVKNTMKAVRITSVGKPLEMLEIPVPQPEKDEVLVRIKASGICRSDVHYRSGAAPPGHTPITPGHEISGIVEATGTGVKKRVRGERVCVHYMKSCGHCSFCIKGKQQFCRDAVMIGKYCDGGYAEFICVPECNAVPIPESVSFEHAAIMMCSTATSYHALVKARLKPGERVAVFGTGGLGMSAIQLALIMGAEEVYAVDINKDRLALAEKLGAIPVNAMNGNPPEMIMSLTGGTGVDVAVEVIGLPLTMQQAVRSLAILGRAALAGITQTSIVVDSYKELIGKEAEIIGVSDHLLSEIPFILAAASRGQLALDRLITEVVPLDERRINKVLDDLESFGAGVRRIISPGN